MTRATGVGSWPGTGVCEAVVTVRDLLGDQLPYLPELPARGPGADIVGRAAGLLVELPVDLQPAGWRMVDRPGRDLARTASFWRQDLDELAEAYDGWSGQLKLQVCGPWTLAAAISLGRGESVLTDPGATRELIESLAEGVRNHLAQVGRLVPGAQLTLQLDEPSLTAVLEGTLATQSGFARVRTIDPADAATGLRSVLAAAEGHATVLHSCHDRPPLSVLRSAGPSAVSVDTTRLGPSGWESVAAGLESGIGLYAGALPTDGSGDRSAIADGLQRVWDQLGLDEALLDEVVLTPTCGLAGATPDQARAATRLTLDLAHDLNDRRTA